MNNPKLLVILTVTIWSFSGYLSRLVSIKSQFLLLSISFFFTFITFIIYFTYVSKKSPLRNLKFKYFFFGLFGYFTYWIGVIQSLRAFNSASEFTVLFYTWPVFTVIFTKLFFSKKKVSTLQQIVEGIGITFGFISIITLATQGDVTSFDISNIKGLSWGLFAGMSFALFSSFSSSVPKSEHSTFLVSSIFISWICMLCLASSELSLIKTITFKDLVVVIIIGVFIDGIGNILWTRAIRLAHSQKIDISSLASFMYITPLISLIIIALLLKETQLLQPYFVLSLLFILLGSYLCQKSEVVISAFKKVTTFR